MRIEEVYTMFRVDDWMGLRSAEIPDHPRHHGTSTRWVNVMSEELKKRFDDEGIEVYDLGGDYEITHKDGYFLCLQDKPFDLDAFISGFESSTMIHGEE